MLTKQGLIDFFKLQADPKSAEVLIYSAQITERLRYTCQFLFQHGLQLRVRFTTNESEFISSVATKLNYSHKNLGVGLWLRPSGLLEENAIHKNRPDLAVRDGRVYFYPAQNLEAGAYHFDIFSAIFFLISRYEEWQDFERDQHGRFEANQSILFSKGLHLQPLVEQWLLEFRTTLQKSFNGLLIPAPQFRAMSTIDVDNLYAFKSKGLARTLGAIGKDLLKGDISNLRERLAVLTGRKEDPFDIYDEISDFCFEQKIPLVYFFLFRTGTRFDRTVSPSSSAFTGVFTSVLNNHATIGIHPSYNASDDPTILENELKSISQKSGCVISFSRQHFLRFNIRTTPKELLDNNIQVDFSMGFASEQGLRAGTTIPFYYYDFENERSTDLLFVPFCTMDGVYTIYKSIPSDLALQKMVELAKQIKQVGGNFVSVFHERSFSDHLYPGFGTLYKNLHRTLKEL